MEDKPDKGEEARKTIEEMNVKVREACWKEITEVLEKHKFNIGANTLIRSDGRIIHQFELIPK